MKTAWLFYGYGTKFWTILGVDPSQFSCNWRQNGTGGLQAALPRAHSQVPGMPYVPSPFPKTLCITDHTAAVPEGSNCSRLRRSTQEGTVFLLNSLPTNGRRVKNKISSSNMTRQLGVHDVHNVSIFEQEWREFCYKLKSISAEHAFGLVSLSMISL